MSLGLSPPALRTGQRVGTMAALVGAPLFLVGTVLHPVRDGEGIARVGDTYGVTHGIQAIGLLLVGVALANLILVGRPRSVVPGNAALFGTLWWLGLLVYDGAHNPATAQYAPELVHTSAGLQPGGALLVVPALVLFPLGYAWLGRSLVQGGLRWPGRLLAGGAVTYTVGGTLLFPLGPLSPLIQPLEVVGAFAFTLGLVLLAVRGGSDR